MKRAVFLEQDVGPKKIVKFRFVTNELVMEGNGEM